MRWTRRAAEPAESAPPAEDGTAKSRKPMGLLPFLLLLALFAWALRSFIVAPFTIPSGSMLPTLFIGDYVLVAKWPYGYSRYSFPFGFPSFDGRLFERLPKRGDIVVFRGPGAQGDFIKRVIGLPGDTIELRGGMVILNGKPMPRESNGSFALPLSANTRCKLVPPAVPMMTRTADGTLACRYPEYLETLPGGRTYPVLDQVEAPRADDFPPTLVPAGHVFMLGDNRDDSMDSRFSVAEGGFGLVPVENLVGRAMVVVWSSDGSASWFKPWTWFPALRTDRVGTGLQ